MADYAVLHGPRRAILPRMTTVTSLQILAPELPRKVTPGLHKVTAILRKVTPGPRKVTPMQPKVARKSGKVTGLWARLQNFPLDRGPNGPCLSRIDR